MKNILKHILLSAVVVSMFSSCENALDVNDSETNVTADVVAPNLLLAGAISSPRGNFEVTANELGNVMMNNWAGDVNNVTGGFLDEFALNITTNFYTSIWNNLYRGSGTYQAILNSDDIGYENHKAIAQILKTYYFQYLVDIYGDVPYSQALQFGENLTPAYDNDQAIYRGLIEDLDRAIGWIQTADGAVAVGGEDTIFNGDMDSWMQFANTLKLRILIRQSNLAGTDGDTAAYLNAQFASLPNNFLMTDAIIQPGFAHEAGKQNPYFGNYGTDAADVDTFDRNFITPSGYAADFLNGDVTSNGIATNLWDPRVERLYEPIDGGGVVGVNQGADNTTAPPLLSRLGDGRVISSEQNSYLMTAAESHFLQSEAAMRGYISGNAEAHFEAGITASFNELGIGGLAAQYITDSRNTNLIGWDGSADKLEAIMTQKWIALNGINGLESWVEYTRTGYPDIPLSLTAQESSKPNRLLYPASEYSTNSANVPNQSTSDAFNTSIFWDVTN